MRLIRPHGGTLVNREVTGIEREKDYVATARGRLALAATNPGAFAPDARATAEPVRAGQTALFGGSRITPSSAGGGR